MIGQVKAITKIVKGKNHPDNCVRFLVRIDRVWVDEGHMTRREADEKKREWNRVGYGCLILKHPYHVGLKIVGKEAYK